jgi:hypothetical protein
MGHFEMGDGSRSGIGISSTTGLRIRARKQPLVEESQWKQMAEAGARVMWPTAEES